MRKQLQVVLAAAVVTFSATVATAQEEQDKCARIKYSEPDTGAARYRLDRIEGQAVLALISEKWEKGRVGGLCVALFDQNRELVASVTTDQKGQFQFTNVPPGKYTLIAALPEDQLRPLVLRAQLYEHPRSASGKSRALLLHMRLKEDQRASFVTSIANPRLRQELLRMYGQDQGIRNEQIERGVDNANETLLRRMNAIDATNTARVREIIKTHGWPGPELVGIDGTEAAFNIVQHSQHIFQKELLPLIEKAYRANRLSGESYALFLDRLLVGDGQPQVYGTQAKPFKEWNGQEPVLYPIKEASTVDKRRVEVGLMPLAEYLKALQMMYFPKSKVKN